MGPAQFRKPLKEQRLLVQPFHAGPGEEVEGGGVSPSPLLAEREQHRGNVTPASLGRVAAAAGAAVRRVTLDSPALSAKPSFVRPRPLPSSANPRPKMRWSAEPALSS